MLKEKMLMVVFGLPGTGKTEVATRLAEKSRGILVSSDVVRKRLFPWPVYSPQESAATYDKMFALGERGLSLGWPVILDAPFNRQEGRTRAVELAKSQRSRIAFIYVSCSDEEVVKARLKARSRKYQPSDADFEIYRLIQNAFAPVLENHTTIDSNVSLVNLDQGVDRLLASRVFHP